MTLSDQATVEPSRDEKSRSTPASRARCAPGPTCCNLWDAPPRYACAKAGLLACGSMPKPAPSRFPSGLDAGRLAAHSCGGSRGFGIMKIPHRIPVSSPDGFENPDGEPTRKQAYAFSGTRCKGGALLFPLRGADDAGHHRLINGKLPELANPAAYLPERWPAPIKPPPARGPNGEAPAPSAHDRDVHRKNEKPQRHHPEAEDRQEPDQTQEHQRDADGNSQNTICRQSYRGCHRT